MTRLLLATVALALPMACFADTVTGIGDGAYRYVFFGAGAVADGN